MRSLVIDDEADARARLIRLLGAHPEVAVIGEAQDGLEAIEKIEELRPDLLFLDIEMPGLKGFEVLRSIPSAIEIPLVIFTTGYDQHALAAFEANALAYLLKPIEPERLSVAIERSSKLCSLSAEKEKERESILRATGEAPKTLRKIVCRKDGRALLVPSEQILWFEVQDGIVRATTAKDSFWVNYQLAELEAALPPEEFFRARREVLVNMSRIKEIKPYFKSSFLLVMSDAASTEIAVSERQAAAAPAPAGSLERFRKYCEVAELGGGRRFLGSRRLDLGSRESRERRSKSTEFVMPQSDSTKQTLSWNQI
jgi:DNA-binding LytR/AlgR family response regulator